MELLPCPFCGRDGGRIRTGYQVLCAWCWAEGPEEGTATEAMAAWNRRAANAPADPALLALAKFAALVVARYRGKVEFCDVDGLELDEAEEDSGMTIDGVSLAPGIADAIAALLAPDAGTGEGVTG